MMTDPIADMLTRIRNANLSKKKVLVLPYSKIKIRILEILKEGNYIMGYEIIKNKFDEIEVKLKYDANGKPSVTVLKRVSKPSRRIYVSKENLPTVLNNFGIAIISTSQGIMSNKEAKKKGIGGEVICEVY
ncbi:30S ribosomal protein S8 [Candidatus Falkowbacteria bacterium RBG_13_39_14]|uniref:Small ribosomal subunit protein uS8 n=1 Tax=Candidatus Falkowbacteria bacterium RBG_13_39_14 TaxID=1797985 RepID=A0A1F5S3K3_9BACT|nr:MAG: 30S ribosomal protein S8 [Candidatus Falkowbacteria bacterium RBG_13_39_14]